MTLPLQAKIGLAACTLVAAMTLGAMAATPVETTPEFEAVRNDPVAGPLDFPVFWAAWRMAVAGANPYDEASYARVLGVGGWVEYMAPAPWAMIWIAPFGVLDLRHAFLWWRISSFLLLVTTVFLAWPLFANARIGPVALLAALVFAPAFFCIFVGQLAVLLSLALVAALRLARSGAHLLAGATLSVMLVKPQLVYLVLLAVLVGALADRKTRAVAWGMVVGLGVQMVLGSIVRPTVIGEWLDWLLSDHVAPWEVVAPTLPSILRGVSFLATGSAPSWPAVLVPAAALAAVVFVGTRSSPAFAPLERWLLLLLPLSLVTTPHAMIYDQSLLLVCHVAMVAWASQRGPRASVLMLLALQVGYVALLSVGPREQFWHVWYPALVFTVMAVRMRRAVPAAWLGTGTGAGV